LTALIIAFVLLQLGLAWSNHATMVRPSCGFQFIRQPDGDLAALPITDSAEVAVRSLHGMASVQSINGQVVEGTSALFEFGFTQKAGRIGLGLGLPSSKRLLQDMGGQISIDSRPGHGTQVRLVIPQSSGSASG